MHELLTQRRSAADLHGFTHTWRSGRAQDTQSVGPAERGKYALLQWPLCRRLLHDEHTSRGLQESRMAFT